MRIVDSALGLAGGDGFRGGLVSNPEIVFADEPTSAPDHDTALPIVRMLKRLG